MKERDIFQSYRKSKIKFSLKTRLTVGISSVITLSIIISYGISYLLKLIWPFSESIPQFLQVILFSLMIALISSYFFSKTLFTPIKEMCKGMQDIADGNFNIRLETKSSSEEIQEMFAGFNMMAKELASTEILQSDFVSNVSHEFKTPINAIEGYTMLLQDTGEKSSEENEYIEKILYNTHRLSSLVSNILLLSKLENQSILTNRETYALDEQIREDILALEHMWEPKQIEFDVELERVNFNGTKSVLHHVWSNLISNAIKFCPSEGKIKLTLTADDSNVEFIIADNGKGFSEDAKRHLFDKFYQEDTSHKSEGNGLGLALVKKIVTLYNGEITADNLNGGGCYFKVTLPNSD